MKKVFLLSLILVLCWSAAAFSKPAIFDTADNSLTMQCLRVKQNGQISEVCYEVRLVLEGNSFAVVSISGQHTQAFENTDQVLDVGTWEIDVPYIPLGSDAYAAVLTFNQADSHLYVSSFGSSTIEISHNAGPSTGSCNIEALTGSLTGVGGCIVFHDADAGAAEAACLRFGGVWDPNGSCPDNYLAACSMPEQNGYRYDEYFYDAGIVAMSAQLKNIPGAPTIDEVMRESCLSSGGTPISR